MLDIKWIRDNAEALDAALAKRGYPGETRPFRAHVTLARDYRPTGEIGGVVPQPCAFTVDEVILFESRREDGRLVYAPLYEYRLAAERVSEYNV